MVGQGRQVIFPGAGTGVYFCKRPRACMGRRFALRAAPAHAPCGMFAEVNPGARCVFVAVGPGRALPAGRRVDGDGGVGSRLALRVTG